LLEDQKHSQTKLKYYGNVPETNKSCLGNTAYYYYYYPHTFSSSSALRPFKFVLGFPHDRRPFSSVSNCCTPISPHLHSSSPVRPNPSTLIQIFLFSPSQCVLVLINQVSYSDDRTSTAIWLYDIFPRFRRSLYKIRVL